MRFGVERIENDDDDVDGAGSVFDGYDEVLDEVFDVAEDDDVSGNNEDAVVDFENLNRVRNKM